MGKMIDLSITVLCVSFVWSAVIVTPLIDHVHGKERFALILNIVYMSESAGVLLVCAMDNLLK